MQFSCYVYHAVLRINCTFGTLSLCYGLTQHMQSSMFVLRCLDGRPFNQCLVLQYTYLFQRVYGLKETYISLISRLFCE